MNESFNHMGPKVFRWCLGFFSLIYNYSDASRHQRLEQFLATLSAARS
jgi:hypothetical protein